MRRLTVRRALAYQNMAPKTVLLPYLKKLSASIYTPIARETFRKQIMSLLCTPPRVYYRHDLGHVSFDTRKVLRSTADLSICKFQQQGHPGF